MLFLEQLKNYYYFQNSSYEYLMAFAIFIFWLVILKLFQMIILNRLKKIAVKTKTDFDDVLISIFLKIKPPFYFLISLYFSIKSLVLPLLATKIIYALFIIVIVWEMIRGLEKLLDYGVRRYLDRNGGGNESAARAASIFIRVILWTVGIVSVLSNLGINVNSLVASLGIGGLAVALAAQNILSDLFSSFSIFIDKPFQIGDFIVIDEHKGTVQKIGLKTTRLKSMQGEELIISNKELTSARVQNFKRLEKRRVVFNLGVVYGIGVEKLASIPMIIKEIIDREEKVEFSRCHFDSYGDFSLNFATVYFVDSDDYAEHMNKKQKINLAIYRKFSEEKIEFAYPTQTIYINNKQ